jgi:Flp pilus assembly protein TadD
MIERGRRAEGLEHLRRARAAAANDAQQLQAIGASLARHGQLEDAIEAFAGASRLDATSSSLEADWCAALLQLGRVQDSLSHCENAVRFDDSSARAHLHLGIALEMVGRAADARRHYERAVELDPDSRASERLTRP